MSTSSVRSDDEAASLDDEDELEIEEADDDEEVSSEDDASDKDESIEDDAIDEDDCSSELAVCSSEFKVSSAEGDELSAEITLSEILSLTLLSTEEVACVDTSLPVLKEETSSAKTIVLCASISAAVKIAAICLSFIR